MRYSIAQARNNLPKLIDRARAGEEVVITRRGEVVATIKPKGAPDGMVIDLDWLKKNQITLESGSDFSWADAIREMRDEGY